MEKIMLSFPVTISPMRGWFIIVKNYIDGLLSVLPALVCLGRSHHDKQSLK